MFNITKRGCEYDKRRKKVGILESFHRRASPRFSSEKNYRFAAEIYKKNVLDDEQHWFEIIPQEPAFDKSPNELEAVSPAKYRSARSNFWAMIREKIQLQLVELNYPNGEKR